MSIASIDGTELYYTSVGHGLPCLVMHGGLGFDHAYLHPGLDPLGDVLHLIYYDHRGNGRSGRPDKETMTHAQFAADADELAAYLGHERVAIMGHSYGGFIALEMALRHPQRISHLILLDTAPQSPAFYQDELMANARRQGATQEMMTILEEPYESDEDMRQKFQKILPLYFKTYDPVVAAATMKEVIVNVDGGAHAGEMDTYNLTSRLGEIDVPTLVIVGRYDFICPPSQAHIIHEGITRSELVIFENSGHLPWLEEPERFFPAVREWLMRTS